MHKGDQVIHSGDGYQIKKNDGIMLDWGIFLDPERDVFGNALRAMSDMPVDWLDDCTRYQVQTLYLSCTGIRRLPAPLAQHHHLQRLYLEGNGLRDVPPVVFTLTTLRVLWLDSNRLERLPEDIYQLVHLQELDLDDNPSLKELPPQMGHRLKQLRWFRCSSTGLPSEELNGGGYRLRGWQLARHGPGALPPHQAGKLLIDCLVIYQEADKKTVVTKGYYGEDSLCGQLEERGNHCCTPASDLEVVRFGLQNCKAVVLCIDKSFPEALLLEVMQSEKPVVAVKICRHLEPLLEEHLSVFKAQGLLVEFEEDRRCKFLIHLLNTKIPASILARGPAAVKIFQQATDGGVVQDQRFRVICVGMERVGKTSLINNLIGKSFNPDEKITHLIEVTTAKSSLSVGTWEDYQTEDGQEYFTACEIAKALLSSGQKSTDVSIEKEDVDPQFPEVVSSGISKSSGFLTSIKDWFKSSRKNERKFQWNTLVKTFNKEGTSPIAQANMEQSTTKDSPVSDNILKLVKELLEKDPATFQQEPLREISIWDFGGQQLYYSLHKVFLSSAAIFLVVFNLTKDMKDPATEWVEDGFSNGQVLEFWLDSISAYTGSSQPLSVLLVGTHAGQVTQTQINKASDYIQDLLKKKSYHKDMVQNSFDDMFYTVENSLEFSQNTEAQRLKRFIEDRLIPVILEKRDKQPLRWLEFEKKMKTLQTEDNQEKQFASLDEVRELAVQCKVIPDRDEEETLLTVLQFLHDIGSIIYYGAEDPAMRDLVILRPEWLLDIFKRIIIVPRPGKKKSFKFVNSWDRLKEKHILEKNLMDYALDDLKENKISIIHLMQKYDFLCERVRDEETSYYVPFVLVQGERELPDINKRVPDKISTNRNAMALVINFNRFLPAGLFHQLAVKTLRWSEQSRGIGAAIGEPEIYYRYLAAPIESKHVLSLEWLPQHQIKVVVKKMTVDLHDLPPDWNSSINVLEFLRRSLTELPKMGLKNVEYDFYFDLQDYPRCRAKCGCRPQLQLHPCLNAASGTIGCPDHADRLIDVSDIQQRFHPIRQGDQDCGQAIGQEPHAEGRESKVEGKGSSSELNDDFLWDVSEALGADWEKVGYRLGIKKADIDRAKANHQFDMTKQAHSLLVQWRQQTPGKLNKRELLATALEKARCIEIAEKHGLQDALGPLEVASVGGGGGGAPVTHIHVEGTYVTHAQFTGPTLLARDGATMIATTAANPAPHGEEDGAPDCNQAISQEPRAESGRSKAKGKGSPDRGSQAEGRGPTTEPE